MSTSSSSGSKPSGIWQPPSLEEMQAMLPQYEFISLLGRGGMGAVYKAVQVSLDRPVAIKVLPGDLIDDTDAQFAERFKNEARTMAKMNHPSIVNAYDFGETNTGLLYIVMEFIDGTDVAKMIASQGKLPPDYALAITAHVSDALNYAHKNGIIHRDIKPANILINMEGAVKVADFGLAKQSDAGMSGLTKTNMAMGTPDFVAPEALIPGIPLDGRADLYAIGVMLYQMLTGEIPRGMWTMPGTKLGTDPRFDAIIGKAMQTDREMRYQSAAEIRQDLDTILTTPRAVVQQPAASPAQTAQKPVAHGPKPPQQKPTSSAGVAQTPPAAKPEAKKSRAGLFIGLGSTVVLLIVGWYLMKPGAATKRAVNVPAPVVATPKPASQPPVAPKSPPASPPSLPQRVATQTLDLLALTDPVLDRISVPSMIGKNEWVRGGAQLVYKPDGKAAKIAPPVSFEQCRDYEIELKASRLSGSDRIHVDVPLKNGRIVPLVLNAQGRKVLNEKQGNDWGPGGPSVHVTIRVIDGAGTSDRIVIQRQGTNEKVLADWSGDLDTLAKSGEAHPGFPKQPVTSIFLMKDPYAIQTFRLRVFEGEAKVLRSGDGKEVGTTSVVSSNPNPLWNGWTCSKGAALTTKWNVNGPEVSTTARTTLWSPASHKNFELEVEWKVGPRGNGGIFYHVQGDNELEAFEMQLCDPANSGSAGSGGLYGVQNESRDASKPVGQWNTAKLVVNGPTREHWINGERVCSYDLSSSDFGDKVRASKLSVKPRMDSNEGRIVLQANAGEVAYRVVRIRALDAVPPILAVAPVSPVAPPMPAASVAVITQPSSDPRLAQLEAGFKSRYEADVQKPFLAAVAALNQSYVANGIGRARAAAQKKGALTEVTALDAEKTRIQNNESLPPADLETLPESLKALRSTYRAAYAKIETERVQKAAPLYDLYLGALDAYIADLTKNNKIEEAQKVKALRDGIAEQKPKTDAGVTTAQTGAAASTGMKRPGAKPAAAESEDSTLGRSRWYEAARWVISVGGYVSVDKGGRQFNVMSEAEIPPGRFDILMVNIEGNGNPKVAGIRDDDFARLSGLKELRFVRLRDIKVGDTALTFLPTTPAIDRLELANLNLTDAVLAYIAPLRELTDLTIENALQMTGAGLEKLASLSILKKITFSATSFSDAAVKVLAVTKNLETLNLTNTLVTDAGVAGLGSFTMLTDLSLSDCKQMRGTSLAEWGSMPALKNLNLHGVPLVAGAFTGIARFTQITDLNLDYVASLDDETLPVLAPLTKLTRFSAWDSRVTGTGFSAWKGCTELRSLHLQNATPISAAGLAAIVATFPKLEMLYLGEGSRLEAEDFRTFAALKSLKHLDVTFPTLDDAALAEIAHCSALEAINVNKSGVTAKGISALKPLKFLTSLLVEGCKNIDDSAIPALKDLKGLKQLYIKENALTADGIAALKKAMPQCNVIR